MKYPMYKYFITQTLKDKSAIEKTATAHTEEEALKIIWNNLEVMNDEIESIKITDKLFLGNY